MSIEVKRWNQEIKGAVTHEDLIALAAQDTIQRQPSLSEKRLLTVAEFARYLGVGQTTARAILKNTCLGYRVKVKDTIMINRKLLDEFLDKRSY